MRTCGYFSSALSLLTPMDGEASSSTVSARNFDVFNSDIQANALKTTRNALTLPSDVAFHRSIDTDFARDLDDFSSRVLSLTNKLLLLAATADTIQSGKGKGKLENQDDVVDNFHSLVVDSMDQLLERTVSITLSILFTVDRTHPGYMSGRIPGCRKSTRDCGQPPEANRVEGLCKLTLVLRYASIQQAVKRGPAEPPIQHASHLQKPQAAFKRKADNTDSLWYPSLSHKFNAQVPLGYDYRDTEADLTSSSLMYVLHDVDYNLLISCSDQHIHTATK